VKGRDSLFNAIRERGGEPKKEEGPLGLQQKRVSAFRSSRSLVIQDVPREEGGGETMEEDVQRKTGGLGVIISGKHRSLPASVRER